jgi:hypothetical protein
MADPYGHETDSSRRGLLKGVAALPAVGAAEYVRRETERVIAEVKGSIPIYPSIDIDIPTALTEKRTQPADIKAAAWPHSKVVHLVLFCRAKMPR